MKTSKTKKNRKSLDWIQKINNFQFAEPTRRLPQRLGFPGGVGALRPTPYTKNVPARRVHQI